MRMSQCVYMVVSYDRRGHCKQSYCRRPRAGVWTGASLTAADRFCVSCTRLCLLWMQSLRLRSFDASLVESACDALKKKKKQTKMIISWRLSFFFFCTTTINPHLNSVGTVESTPDGCVSTWVSSTAMLTHIHSTTQASTER